MKNFLLRNDKKCPKSHAEWFCKYLKYKALGEFNLEWRNMPDILALGRC